jgi:DNA-binding GntR family transcriptional regulator
MSRLSPDLPGDEIALYLHADRQFHTAYVSTLGNPLVSDFYDSIWRLNEWSTRGQAGRLRNQGYRSLNDAQHRAILAALEKHSAQEAVHTLREHLRPFSEVAVFLDEAAV